MESQSDSFISKTQFQTNFALVSKNVILPIPGSTESFFVTPAGVLIKDGQIAQTLILNQSYPQHLEEIKLKYPDYIWEDLGELYISPGLIDINISFNSDPPSRIQKELDSPASASTLQTPCSQTLSYIYQIETKMACKGGVTTAIQSPNLSLGSGDSSASLANKKRLVSQSSLYCDLGFLALVTPENMREISDMIKEGALGFKAYMMRPAKEVGYFSDQRLNELFNEFSGRKQPLVFHAETTTERFLYMSSPYREEDPYQRLNRPSPKIPAFQAAFPQQIESSDISPIASPTLSSLRSSDSQKEPENHLQSTRDNLDLLSRVELQSYTKSGSTVFQQNMQYSGGFRLNLIQEISNNVSECSLNKKRPAPIITIMPKYQNSHKSYSAHLVKIPVYWETNAISKLTQTLQNYPSTRLHISNLSSSFAIQLLNLQRKNFKLRNLTCQTAAFNFMFSQDDINQGDTRFKNNPPIRTKENQISLNQQLNDFSIDIVTSAHRRVPIGLKALQKGDFNRAVSGIYSVGTALGTLLTACRGTMADAVVSIARMMSYTPAKVFNLERKGSILKGKDADLVVWDPFQVYEVEFQNDEGLSPFAQMMLPGKVHRTYLRGELVFCQSEIRPMGRLL